MSAPPSMLVQKPGVIFDQSSPITPKSGQLFNPTLILFAKNSSSHPTSISTTLRWLGGHRLPGCFLYPPSWCFPYPISACFLHWPDLSETRTLSWHFPNLEAFNGFSLSLGWSSKSLTCASRPCLIWFLPSSLSTLFPSLQYACFLLALQWNHVLSCL